MWHCKPIGMPGARYKGRSLLIPAAPLNIGIHAMAANYRETVCRVMFVVLARKLRRRC